mmetsp:Transcript_120628/g.313214  ORF Transcript_120628/g.313214 Transcript_120628/m.313214 type:complete len:442 (+) Transcript_120628:478-1803(+)
MRIARGSTAACDASEGADVRGDVENAHRPQGRQLASCFQHLLGPLSEQDRKDDLNLALVATKWAFDDRVCVRHVPAQIQRDAFNAYFRQLLTKVARRPDWNSLVAITVEQVDRRHDLCNLLLVLLPVLRVEEPLWGAALKIACGHVVHDLGIEAPGGQVRPQLDEVVGPRDREVSLELRHGPNLQVASLAVLYREVAAVFLAHCFQKGVLEQQHRGEVGARTLPDHHAVLHIAAEELDILEDPAHAAADVLHHLGHDGARPVPVVDAHGDDTEVHEPQAQLRVVAAVADDECAPHDGDHNRHLRTFTFLCCHRFFGNVDVKVLALLGSIPDAALDARVMVVGQHDADGRNCDDHRVDDEAEPKPNSHGAELEPLHSPDSQVHAIDQSIEVVGDYRKIPVAPSLEGVVHALQEVPDSVEKRGVSKPLLLEQLLRLDLIGSLG